MLSTRALPLGDTHPSLCLSQIYTTMDLTGSSFSVTDAGTASMLPPPRRNIDPDTARRKKKAPTLRESDWEPYKDSIIQLHLNENRTLSEVKTLIEQKYGFAAGYVESPSSSPTRHKETDGWFRIRQYRSRLSRWKLDKNIKPEEMKAIVRRRQQRNLVETGKPGLRFRVRGQEVEPQKIERWMKSHDVTKSMVYAPSPAARKLIDMHYRSYKVVMEISYPLSNQLCNHVRNWIADPTVSTFSWTSWRC